MVKHSQSSQKSNFAMSLQYLKKGWSWFLHVDKHQSFEHVNFNTLGIKIFCKVILTLLFGMIKHSQSTQSNMSAISLYLYLWIYLYILLEVRNRVHFLHADKHQSFYKFGLLFLMEVTKYVQSTQNRRLVIFLQYIKKRVSQLLLCSLWYKTFSILRGSSHVYCYLFPCTTRLYKLSAWTPQYNN